LHSRAPACGVWFRAVRGRGGGDGRGGIRGRSGGLAAAGPRAFPLLSPLWFDLCWQRGRALTNKHTHTHTHTRARARARTHTHTRACAHNTRESRLQHVRGGRVVRVELRALQLLQEGHHVHRVAAEALAADRHADEADALERLGAQQAVLRSGGGGEGKGVVGWVEGGGWGVGFRVGFATRVMQSRRCCGETQACVGARSTANRYI
jgi:hypothetical protein